MNMYDVQVTTDFGETIVVQVAAPSPEAAESAAITVVESVEAGTVGQGVVYCFALG